MEGIEEISLAEMEGFRIGHAQNHRAGTGCSVIIPEGGAAGGVDVRGGAPGTRETDLLKPGNLAEKINAVLLTGGSAFGLAAADGVMKYLEERGSGFAAGEFSVPLVPAAVLFDLNCGEGKVRPDRKMGYQACLKAASDQQLNGNYGAGTGATVGKYAGQEKAMKAGIGQFIYRCGEVKIGVLAAVNCLGDVYDPESCRLIAGARTKNKNRNEFLAEEDREAFIRLASARDAGNFTSGNTVLAAVFTNARLSPSKASRLAGICHDAIARTVRPSHTMLDGDTIFVLARGPVEADLSLLAALGVEAATRAIIRAVKRAESAYGFSGYADLSEIEDK